MSRERNRDPRAANRQERRGHRLRRALFVVAVLVAALASFEIAVRVAFPRINTQETDSSLFRAGVFGPSPGHEPGARGSSFGQEVHIDERGLRATRAEPTEPGSEHWLVLGDSVTFGVGVAVESTFIGRLGSHVPAVSVSNTATLGFSVRNYRDVLDSVLDGRSLVGKPDRVLLMWCLNDVYGYTTRLDAPPEQGPFGRTRVALRSRSKLYLLLKGVLLDRSHAWFEFDRAWYEVDHREDVSQALDVVADMADRTSAEGIPLMVAILPYEYQLRSASPAALLPQRELTRSLQARGVPHVDLRAAVAAEAESRDLRSTDLYLYADAMHLSARGHAVVLEALVSSPEFGSFTGAGASP